MAVASSKAVEALELNVELVTNLYKVRHYTFPYTQSCSSSLHLIGFERSQHCSGTLFEESNAGGSSWFSSNCRLIHIVTRRSAIL